MKAIIRPALEYVYLNPNTVASAIGLFPCGYSRGGVSYRKVFAGGIDAERF